MKYSKNEQWTPLRGVLLSICTYLRFACLTDNSFSDLIVFVSIVVNFIATFYSDH